MVTDVAKDPDTLLFYCCLFPLYLCRFILLYVFSYFTILPNLLVRASLRVELTCFFPILYCSLTVLLLREGEGLE